MKKKTKIPGSSGTIHIRSFRDAEKVGGYSRIEEPVGFQWSALMRYFWEIA